MEALVNKDRSNDLVLRISPASQKMLVEEHKPGGVVSYKEIHPLDLYYSLNNSYRDTSYLHSGLLPENCLSVSLSTGFKRIVLWNPELRADIIYRDVEYPNFPIPRLVFAIRILNNGKVADCFLGVVADQTPAPDTVMYHYPFSNVHPDLKVCVGNNVMPRYKKQTALKHFPRFLLGLPDNDDMYNPGHNKLGLDHKALLEHMKDKDPSYYYSHVLVENGKVLSDFIGR